MEKADLIGKNSWILIGVAKIEFFSKVGGDAENCKIDAKIKWKINTQKPCPTCQNRVEILNFFKKFSIEMMEFCLCPRHG